MRIAQYLDRVGVSAPRPDLDTLRQLHLANRRAFLFENLTIQTGGSISLAVDDLERKFLDDGRGGYCFEHNTLFAAALREIGFAPTTLLGRVRRGPPDRWCRTHMVLLIQMPGARQLLCDVGFGGLGLLEPIDLRDGARAMQGGLAYALRRETRLWVLSMRDADGATTDLYEFADDPQTPGDVEVANHFTATHPDSIFRRTLTVQRSSAAERVILRSDALTRYRDGHPSETPIDRHQLRPLAREVFGVDIADGPLVCDQYPSAKLTT